ncbi:DNA repair photolyase [Arthrobacter crystallopoietes BAB-32]|uniref:DNA repair photolyase n=1 Tax=Arthrobacter crystallopoietes BAB-32 TaxID=1246476 RepID=N1UZY1_9MICC|nr:Rv2578c family radical SAM protein [Arthrobacter crystallopoietes]EMY35961.1 DNA repair photolyase [Arthrobacter crystallopoietes BAB-32]
MRWDGQKLATEDASALPGLRRMAGLLRSTRTPEFSGVTFHEIACKSALSRVPAQSHMPFEWTINPTRGCLHQCTYCFARKTHEYLDLDSGRDFDTQIIVKTNIVDVLRRELAKPSWKHEPVALGTNSDPYMRAEGRYQLMPGIIRALSDSGTPFSILTKGPLLKRDLPLLAEASRRVDIGIGVSLAFAHAHLQQQVEPGTPTPQARLDLIKAVSDAGFACGVMAMPILPWLTDGDEHLDLLFSRLAAAGASGVTAGALHLRPGAREWFLQWLAREYPQLVARYQGLYNGGTYASKDYRHWLAGRVRYFQSRHGLTGRAAQLRVLKAPSTRSADSLNADSSTLPALSLAEPTLF